MRRSVQAARKSCALGDRTSHTRLGPDNRAIANLQVIHYAHLTG
jgi:hypothetical protein